MAERIRHICGISGGKDSSALAVYLRNKVPDMEYFFCDTGAELPETYEYLTRLEVILGKPIARLNADRGFEHWFDVFRGTLPSPQMRWCTKNLKIKPIEEWIGDSPAISYVAIRADESNRKGYISTKSNIQTRFPFVEDGIDHDAVMRILEDAGIGLPEYYEWRTRSGCYFCFYQRKAEWIGLAERHPRTLRPGRGNRTESGYATPASTATPTSPTKPCAAANTHGLEGRHSYSCGVARTRSSNATKQPR